MIRPILALALAFVGTAEVAAQVDQTTDTSGTATAAPGGLMTIQPMDLMGGMLTGSERFSRQNRQAGQFVGGEQQGVGAQRGAANGLQQGGLSQFGQFGRMGGMNMMNPMGSLYTASMMNSMMNQRRPLRLQVQLGIEPTPTIIAATAPAKVNERVQARCAKLPLVRAANGKVQVAMDGSIAVLRGEVKSEHDRDLIARVLLLEPGIADVRNELVVATPASPKPAEQP